MKWRIAEGNGECLYELGVSDNGQLVGLEESDLNTSIQTLTKMAHSLDADLSIIRTRTILVKQSPNLSFSLDSLNSAPLNLNAIEIVDEMAEGVQERFVAEVLVRKGISDTRHFIEVRVSLLGGADAGSVLSASELDNGRGKSRLNLLRHRHEIATGRTSSIAHQIIGFNPKGDLINYSSQPQNSAKLSPSEITVSNIDSCTWEQIIQSSSKIISFLDTCGHEKYQRTTVSGIVGNKPDYACLILSASASTVSQIPREHLNIAVALTVPVFIVITKIDVASKSQLTRTVNSLLDVLKSPGIRRVPMVIQNEDDLVVAVSSLVSSSIIPVFLTSSVTGENMNLLIKFFNLLQKPVQKGNSSKGTIEYAIEETFYVPGLIVGGLLSSGYLNVDSDVFIGPDKGKFMQCRIKSIHRQRIPVSHLSLGQAGTCSLVFLDPNNLCDFNTQLPLGFKVRKGQVLLSEVPKSGFSGLPDISLGPSVFEEKSPEIIDVPSSTDDINVPLPFTVNCESSKRERNIGYSACTFDFESEIHVIHSSEAKNGTITAGTSGTLFIGAIRQGSQIISIKDSNGKWAILESASKPDSEEGYYLVKGRRRSSSQANEKTFNAALIGPVSPKRHILYIPSSPGLQGDGKDFPVLRTGGRGLVTIKFLHEPEYITVGSHFVFGGDGVKCVGTVTGI